MVGSYRSVLFAFAVSLLALPLIAGEAFGRDRERARASKLFVQGNKLYKRGLYLDALKKFRQAQKLFPSHKIDLNIGSTLDALGRRTEAAAYFQRFLSQGSSAPERIKRLARERLRELKGKLASVRLTCLEEGAVVRVDSKSVGRTPLDLPIHLEPGEHTLELIKQGFTPFSRTLKAKAGEKYSVDAMLTRPASTPEPVPATAPVNAEAGKGSAPTVDKTDGPEDRGNAERHRLKSITGYAALGLGAALTATAAMLYGVGATRGASAHEAYNETEDHAEIREHRQDVEAAKHMLIAGHVLMGVSVVAYGLSIFQLVTRPEQPSHSTASVEAGPLDGGAYLSVRGCF